MSIPGRNLCRSARSTLAEACTSSSSNSRQAPRSPGRKAGASSCRLLRKHFILPSAGTPLRGSWWPGFRGIHREYPTAWPTLRHGLRALGNALSHDSEARRFAPALKHWSVCGGSQRPGLRGTRRKYIHVGSAAASMPPTVPRRPGHRLLHSWLALIEKATRSNGLQARAVADRRAGGAESRPGMACDPT
jgi:hypothetical protein